LGDSLGGVDSAAGALADGAAAADTGAIAEGLTEGLGEGISNAASSTASATEAAAEAGGGLLNPSTASNALAATPATPAAEAASMSAENAALGGFDGLGGTGVIAPPSPGGLSQWWSGLSSTAKAKMLSGGADAAMKYWDQNQKNEFEREKYNLSREQYDTSMKNASAQPVVQFKSYAPPKTSGLLNPTAKG